MSVSILRRDKCGNGIVETSLRYVFQQQAGLTQVRLAGLSVNNGLG